MTCPACSAEFEPVRVNQRYCSTKCRSRLRDQRYYAKWKARQPVVEKRPYRPPRRLRCHFCRGRHLSSDCPTRNEAEVVRRYGTMGPNREYIPPRGVRVRVRVLPHNVFGEDLKRQVGGRFGR